MTTNTGRISPFEILTPRGNQKIELSLDPSSSEDMYTIHAHLSTYVNTAGTFASSEIGSRFNLSGNPLPTSGKWEQGQVFKEIHLRTIDGQTDKRITGTFEEMLRKFNYIKCAQGLSLTSVGHALIIE